MAAISGYSQPYDGCLDWPRPVRTPPPLPERPLPASVPVLIVGGDLDSLTPFADAEVFGPKLGAAWHPQALTRPRLVNGKPLSIDAMNMLATILAFSPLDPPYAGIPALHYRRISGHRSGEHRRQRVADAAIRSFGESHAGCAAGSSVDGDITLPRRRLHAGQQGQRDGTPADGVYEGPSP